MCPLYMSKNVDEVGRCDPPPWGSYLCTRTPVPGRFEREQYNIAGRRTVFQSDVFIIIYRPVTKKTGKITITFKTPY